MRSLRSTKKVQNHPSCLFFFYSTLYTLVVTGTSSSRASIKTCFIVHDEEMMIKYIRRERDG